MNITTVTQKGQVTIPAFIRKKYDLKPGAKVIFSEDKQGTVRVKPVPDFFSFRGSLKTKKKYSKKEIHQIVGKYLAKRYVKTLKNFR